MLTYDERSAECLVFTEKEGLLSRVAHDLSIRVGRFSITIDPDRGSVDARFDARSLRVVSAMKDGAADEGALSEADKKKIEESILADVLHAGRHPEVRFVSTKTSPVGQGYRIEGTLTLMGRAKPIAVTTSKRGDRQIAEVTLHQPDFGIRPYSAMFGTLKVKPDVRVRLAVPDA